MTKQKSLVERLNDEADLCRNEGASDIAALLDEAARALTWRDPKKEMPAPQVSILTKDIYDGLIEVDKWYGPDYEFNVAGWLPLDQFSH